MMQLSKFLLSAVFLLSSMLVSAQVEKWKLFSSSDEVENKTEDTPSTKDSLSSVIHLDFSQPDGEVTESKDERIDEISKILSTPIGNNPVTIDGFRVQIFFDQNMVEVNKMKNEFIKAYPHVKTYMDFDAPPNHRLRVGNFRSKLDAQRFQNEISKDYPNATIVKNIQIELPPID